MPEKNETNKVRLIGEVISEFTFNHEVFGERFYFVNLSVARLSGQVDVIPVSISERLMDVSKDYRDMMMEVIGQFRSFNHRDGERSHLILFVFAQKVQILEESAEYAGTNQICLDGYICKKPIYRQTPLGREIADMLLAVNRLCGKTDYIPCIVWGRNARYGSRFGVGSHVCVEGRIQSREYMKKLSETECEKRVAYEVSVSKYLDNRRSLEKGEDDGGGAA